MNARKWVEVVVGLAGFVIIFWINPYRGMFDPYAPPFTGTEQALIGLSLVLIGVPVFVSLDRYIRTRMRGEER